MIEKKEADLTRVRGLRDALQADVNERKARDGEREGSLSQSKILASARGVCSRLPAYTIARSPTTGTCRYARCREPSFEG